MTSLQKILEPVLSVLHQLGWESSDFSSLETAALRAGTSKRAFKIFFVALLGKPIIALAIPQGFHLPVFEDLYSRYLDFNFDLYLLFKHLELVSPETSYLLYFDEQRAFFYDIRGQECLIHCSSPGERTERLFPSLEKRKVESGSLEAIGRKTGDQLGRELTGWLKIWSAELATRTNARKTTLERFCKKLILARYYRVLFGPESSQILFEGFVNDPSHRKASRQMASSSRFFKELFEFFQSRFDLEIFEPHKAELSFLHKAEKKKHLLDLFLLEFNLVARVKFSLDAFLSAWCPEQEWLLFTKKTYTASDKGIKRRWAVEDMMVLWPVLIDLRQEGTPWALHLFEETVKHWMNYNQSIYGAPGTGGDKGTLSSLQMDLFGLCPQAVSRDGRIPDVVNHALHTSFRILGIDKTQERENFLFLLTAKCFELWKKYEIQRKSLKALEDVFKRPIL